MGVQQIDTRLHELEAVRKDLPSLERKVSAKLTEQLLNSQPQLLDTLNRTLTASGGTLLIEAN